MNKAQIARDKNLKLLTNRLNEMTFQMSALRDDQVEEMLELQKELSQIMRFLNVIL